MGLIHFMNVKDGDCIWVQHSSGHNTVIDISNGNEDKLKTVEKYIESESGNYNQKENSINPIKYLKNHNVSSIFRFILTHPDMDHMDGLKALFTEFEVLNFWDTENTKKFNANSTWGKYQEADWLFYQKLRKSKTKPKTLHLYANSHGEYYNRNEDGKSGADGLYILAPTSELVDEANQTEEYNDCSYVILYKTGNGKKVIFAGDSAEKTWNYILENYREKVSNIDILIAPHHGRKSGGNDNYLNVLKPKLTLFGNAKSKHLDYNSWNSRGLDHITNNQANCVVININSISGIDVYVTHEAFARKRNSGTYYNKDFDTWYIMTI